MKRLLIPLLAVAALVVPAMASSASVEPTTIEVASVDLKAESLTSTDGTTYFVTDSTRFHPTAFPAGPEFPGSVAWNELVSKTSKKKCDKACLALLRSVCGGKHYPTPTVVDRRQPLASISALRSGSQWLLTDVTPVLPPS